MDFLLELIKSYGYYIVFVGTLLEGETIVALAGFVAHQGYLDLHTIIPVAIIGATLGDHVFFLFGRYKGRKIIANHPGWHDRVGKIHMWLERHQNWLIFGSRFLYGFRAITPIVLGTSKVALWRFSLLNILGAVAWAFLFVFGGYIFGDAVERFLGNIKKFEGTFVGIILFAIIVVQGGLWLRRKRLDARDK